MSKLLKRVWDWAFKPVPRPAGAADFAPVALPGMEAATIVEASASGSKLPAWVEEHFASLENRTAAEAAERRIEARAEEIAAELKRHD